MEKVKKILLGCCFTMMLLIISVILTTDKVGPGLNEEVAYGKAVEVTKTIDIEIAIGDVIREFSVEPGTVEEVLGQAGLDIGVQDIVKPDLDKTIKPGEQIKIVRVIADELTVSNELPYETEYREDNTKERGSQSVQQSGQKGSKEHRYRLTFHNDLMVDKVLVDTTTTREPVTEVIVKGTKPREQIVSSRGGEELRYREKITVKASAYTHTGNKTYTGVMPQVGTVAVDPNVIPLGTRLYVEGYGRGVASDTGGAIKGNRIDVFMDTREEALRWGLKEAQVYILD